MSKKASEEALDALHGAIAKALAERIKDGSATAADLAVARQFLKDNGIDAVPKQSKPLKDLAASLPFPGEEDGSEEYKH
jgi:hypothetical protein